MWDNATKYETFPHLMEEGKVGEAFKVIMSEYDQVDM